LQDEIYFIVRGQGVLCHDGKRDRFESGDLLFVAAGIEHQIDLPTPAIRKLVWSILRRMTQEKTERANCHFVIKQNLDGKPQIIVERYHQTISVLNNTVLGFDLLGGTTLEQAKKAVAFLNENVLNVFVTRKQHGTILA
jgi:hypothetical protein